MRKLAYPLGFGPVDYSIVDIVVQSAGLVKYCILKVPSNYPCTRGNQKVRGKVLFNRIAFIDCNENS